MFEDPKSIMARCLKHCVTELITVGVLTRSSTMICLQMSSMPGRLLASGSSEAAHSSARLLHVPWAQQLASITAAHLRDHKVEVTCLLLHCLSCPPTFLLCCFGHRDQMFRYRRDCSESVIIKWQKPLDTTTVATYYILPCASSPIIHVPLIWEIQSLSNVSAQYEHNTPDFTPRSYDLSWGVPWKGT